MPAVVAAALHEHPAALLGRDLAAHDPGLRHLAAVVGGEQHDGAGARVDDGSRVAPGVAVPGRDDGERAPGAAAVRRAPQDDVDVAGVARAAASALGEGENGAFARRDGGRDAVRVVAALARDVRDGGGAAGGGRGVGRGGEGRAQDGGDEECASEECHPSPDGA
ncbi:hypothetical protein GCM10010256_05720 [Streptomyces coeruleorubidus]|nr:hypothetical protein GCM10010256_05720 [Streptomyces coeruleorubidus]